MTRLHLVPGSESSARSTSPPTPIRVVLADDHSVVRRSLRRVLDDEPDIELIAEASDLAQAVHEVVQHRPDVLVADLRLRDGPTLDTIGRLRSEVPETGIVATTMDESPLFAEQAIEAGAVGFVLKDRADSELLPAIRAASKGEEFVSPRVAPGLAALQRAVGQHGLTARETEILRLIALGHTTAE